MSGIIEPGCCWRALIYRAASVGRAEQLGNCIGASVGNANAVIMGLPGGNPEAALVVELEVVLELAGALDAGTSRLMVLPRAAMRSARGASEGGWPSPSAVVDVGEAVEVAGKERPLYFKIKVLGELLPRF